MFGSGPSIGHYVDCGHSTNWTCPCTCDEISRSWGDDEPAPPPPSEADQLRGKIESLQQYLTHHEGCSANDLDYLDHTPCTCGLRLIYNPKGRLDPTGEKA